MNCWDYLAWAIRESGGKVGPQHSPWYRLTPLQEAAQEQQMDRDLIKQHMVLRSPKKHNEQCEGCETCVVGCDMPDEWSGERGF